MSDQRSGPSSVDEVVEILIELHGLKFAGRSGGKYRISRKYFRQIAARRKLTAEFVALVTDALFERGYVLVDLETHFVVLRQGLFDSYRRVTDRAIALLKSVNGSAEPVASLPDGRNFEASSATP